MMKYLKILKKEKISSDFFKKIIGSNSFCYFLQKKRWLGVSKMNKFGTGDPNYLRSVLIFTKKKRKFFNKFLEFFPMKA